MLIPEDLERLNPQPGTDPIDYAIEHALAFVLPQGRLLQNRFDTPNLPADYVYPAANLETSFGSANPFALAAGQRIRLKDAKKIVDATGKTIDETALKPITRIFLNTLRDYGAYLVDGGLGFGFSAEDYHTAPLDLDLPQIKYLIGAGASTTLPVNETAWQLVINELDSELNSAGIRFGIPTTDSHDAESLHLNFEVISNPVIPADVPRGGGA